MLWCSTRKRLGWLQWMGSPIFTFLSSVEGGTMLGKGNSFPVQIDREVFFALVKIGTAQLQRNLSET